MKVILSLVLSVISLTAYAGSVDPCARQGNALWEGLQTYSGPTDRQARIKSVIDQEAWGLDNALTVAVWFGYDDLTRELIRKRDVLDSFGAQSLYLAASMGRLEEMFLLLNAGVSPDAELENGFTPIYGAAQYGCKTAIKLLVDSGANMHHQAGTDWSVLKFAVVSGQLETARFLVAHGYLADDNEKKEVQEVLQRMGANSEYDSIFGLKRQEPVTVP